MVAPLPTPVARPTIAVDRIASRVADDRSYSDTEAPWWQDPGRVPAPAPEEPSIREGVTPQAPPADLSWFERREPFLKALSARIEPVEDVAGRALAENLERADQARGR